ncbi:hypothetical protein LSH36_232g03050 [Paralvinella palmiformis]|uniref:UBP-type domain-containing protein n=1 Tax=Paralvinella palmiformis TaxID=53620 RepID=A0AAD9JPJ4_9ANNE|nr:hypothetical protein LSH36_232g03050 [Paralvinella palmiformis]
MSGGTKEAKTSKDDTKDEKCGAHKLESTLPDEHVVEASGSGVDRSQSDDLIGACGGHDPAPGITLQEGMQLCSVVPLPWCPHLNDIKPVPSKGLDTNAPCLQCGNIGENWVCLVCYEVHCSRYINEHMLMHGLATEHKIVLSFVDLSVWCYGCDSYVNHEVHLSKSRCSTFTEDIILCKVIQDGVHREVIRCYAAKEFLFAGFASCN